LKKTANNYQAIVMGASAGGIDAWSTILPDLPDDLPVPIIIAQHTSPTSDNYIPVFLNDLTGLNVKEAEEKEEITAGCIYFSIPNYHLLIEEDNTFSLSTEEKKNFSRPSIDILFESASMIYGGGLIGILLTGSNSDGSLGLKTIKENGGLTIVENPETAQVNQMPLSAIKKFKPDIILDLDQIGIYIRKLFE